ncbi:MAG TPA: aldehyde dehydrogenase family protein, partial [Rhodospirillales bacterium]
MTQELHHFIDGKKVKGNSGRFGDVYNPATGEVTKRVPLASAAETQSAIAAAAAALPAWAATPPARRAQVLFKFRELLIRNIDKMAELLSSEHGKTVPDARGSVTRGVEVVEFACGIPHLLKGEFSEG